MSLFFEPETKIQKDRVVLKSIDLELAQRSLPGVLGYFLVYLVVDFLMGYPEEYRLLSYSAGLTILIIAAARMYVAFGLERQYSRGPARWRQTFLSLSLINGIVWTVLLTFVLIHPQFEHAMTLALAYTAGLTAGIAIVYAQYVRFVQIYLLITLVPPAIILILKLNVMDAVLGLGMVAYLVFLLRESKQYHVYFWQRVDNKYQLEQKVALLNESRIENEQRADINENALASVMQMIKTPLQGVLGMMSILSDSKLDKSQNQALEIATQSGDSLVSLITDLEDFTQLRKGNLQFENKYFDLRKYTEHTIESLGNMAHQLGLELSYLYDVPVPSRVSLDKAHIGQAIQTMINFAVNNAAQGEVVFKVSSSEVAAETVLRFCTYFEADDLDVESIRIQLKNMRIDDRRVLDSNLLSLMITGRVIELMGGELRVEKLGDHTYVIRALFTLEASSQQIDAFQPDKSLQAKILLLIDMPERASKGLAGECQSWGMTPHIMYSEQLESIKAVGGDYWLVNIPVNGHYEETVKRIKPIIEAHGDSTKVLLYGPMSQMHSYMEQFPECEYLTKPAGRYALHQALVLHGSTEDESQHDFYMADGDKKVLVAENNPMSRLVLESLLMKLGYHYKMVVDGYQLLHEAENSSFDLILTACQLPQIDGFEATRQIRLEHEKKGTGVHLPIIAMTSKGSADEERQCLMAGMDDSICLPMTLKGLGATLQRWLD